MKTRFLIKDLFFILFIAINILCTAQDTAKVSASFIGSHGYLLQSSHSKVALDALIYWEGDNYGYIKPSRALADKMEMAESPFDSLDLILIGHAHTDHYNTEIVERSMLRNKKAVLVTTPEVFQDIKSHVDSFSFYSDRIWVPDLEFYHSADTIINNIPLTITSIPHGSANMELYIPSIVLDSIKFVQLNGWNSITPEAYDTLGFNKKPADVIFLCYSYILDNSKFNNFKNHLHPLFSTILYKKINNTIIVDTLNNAPILSGTVENQESDVNEPFSYTIPEDLFSDREGDPIKISVTSTSGGALPAWLTYHSETRLLEGTPSGAGTTYLKINGADSHLASRSVIFNIRIKAVSGINLETVSPVKIYPNPANEKITLNFEGYSANYEIFDLSGNLMKQGAVENSGSIDVSALTCGVYNIRIKQGELLSTSSFIIE
jgi:ribonuclease BN (tRNA processing enzyme)